MNKWRSVLFNAGLYLYAVFCGLLVYSWPLNKYEWMLDEPDAIDEGRTYCTLPIDQNSDFASVPGFLAIFIFTSVVVGISLKRKSFNQLLIIFNVVLYLAWIAKFFLFVPKC
jgi:hypothetical protein